MRKKLKHAPKLNPRVEQVVEAYVEASSFDSDPQGSYTGKSEVKNEKPVQDADDL